MRSIVISLAASSLLGALVIAQAPTDAENHSRSSRYIVTDLGKVGGSPGGPHFIANNGLVSGAAAVPNGSMHAVLWFNGLKLDIGAPGLGGAHSAAFGVNEEGQAVGEAETSVPDGEDFCGFNALGLLPTATRCRPFLWQHGAMTRLPTLGGPNGVANSINNRGIVAGFAENTLRDPDPACPVFQFKPVIWENGQIQELSTLRRPGRSRGRDQRPRSGCRGIGHVCTLQRESADSISWRITPCSGNDGMVTDLGNLGGTGGIAGNHACAINNHGQVVGHSELANNTTFHGFLWTRETRYAGPRHASR